MPTGQNTTEQMVFIGQRAQAARKEHRISQTRLAEMVGTSASQISLIESNKSKPSLRTATAIARALDTSLDYLTGTSGDPRSPGAIAHQLQKQSQQLFGSAQPGAAPKESSAWKDYVAITEVDTAAGAGAVLHQERVTGGMKFPVLWLHREGLNAHSCRIIRVVGESMGAHTAGRLLDPGQPRQPGTAPRENLRHPPGRRADRQANGA